MNILDLRQTSVRQLEPLLEEEARHWHDELHWDYRGALDLIKRFLEAHALCGCVAFENGSAAGYSFYVLEEQNGLIGGAVFESDAAAEGVGFEKTLDEVKRAAVVPMQLVMPVARFFLEERLELADTGLPKVENIHGRRAVPQRRFMIAETAVAARK